MAKNYKTPGVYIDEVPMFPPSVVQVETSIPVFIGYTEKAGDNTSPLPTKVIDNTTVTEAKKISSLPEYEQYFFTGTQPATVQISETYAADGVSLINRGVIVNLPAASTMHNHMQLYFSNGGGDCYIISIGNPATGIAAANMLAGLKMAAGYDEPSLTVIPQVVELPSVTDSATVYNAALQQAADLQDRFMLLDCYGDEPENLRNNTGTANLQYGAAYHPFLQPTFDNTVGQDYLASISITLHKIFANGTEAVTHIHFADLAPDVQAAVKAAIEKQNVAAPLPPCSAIAGIYANMDSTRGVWKAPANISLNTVAGLTKKVTDQEQAGLNVDAVTGKSINVIRTFAGRGILVWGARTLAGNDNEWRYISVRRFFIMVEESAKKAVAPFVFEPNDANAWTRIRAVLQNFLTLLWRDGALQGTKPEESFFVKVGLGQTMTSLDILEGRLIIEIGMAPVRPAEFIIISITQLMAQS